MAYDKNQCTFSGKVQDVKQLNTKTGNPMSSLLLHCWRENIRCVGWAEIAGQMLSFRDDDGVEISGKIQSSNWSKDDGTKVYSYQVIVNEIKADTDRRGQVSQQPAARSQQQDPYGHDEYDTIQDTPF